MLRLAGIIVRINFFSFFIVFFVHEKVTLYKLFKYGGCSGLNVIEISEVASDSCSKEQLFWKKS